MPARAAADPPSPSQLSNPLFFAVTQVQDTITLLDASLPPVPAGGQQQQQPDAAPPARGVVPAAVWELNRLRSMLAAVVLQWATCLQEGAAGSHAAPPNGAGMLSSVLATRRAAQHSRQGSLAGQEAEVEAGGGGAGEEGQPAAPAGPQQPQQAAAGEPLVPLVPAVRTHQSVQRSASGGSLGRQFLEAGLAEGSEAAAAACAASELDFGAPSLVADEGGGGGSAVASPTAAAGQGGSAIPTGLVARYIAMFDQQRGHEGSAGSPAGSLAARSQRTLTWVQQDGSAAGGAAAGGAGGEQPPSLASQQQQQGQQPLLKQRSSLFRLDLTSPDPETLLTPTRLSSAGEGKSPGAVAACCPAWGRHSPACEEGCTVLLLLGCARGSHAPCRPTLPPCLQRRPSRCPPAAAGWSRCPPGWAACR